MKRLISLMLSLVMIVTAVLACDFSAFADSVTEIWTVEDLYNVRCDLSGNYKLMSDIDLTEAIAEGNEYSYLIENGWEPIGGYAGDDFSGIFDGNNHIISGLRINADTKPTDFSGILHLGLFSSVSGTIKNLHMTDGSITAGFNFRHGTCYAGSIAGKLTGNIENCSNDVEIQLYKDVSTEVPRIVCVGGLIGCSENGTITNCKNTSYLYALGKAYEANYYQKVAEVSVGGIVGYTSNSTVSLSFNQGSIVAASEGYYTYVSKTNFGNETRYVYSTSYAGGICGRDNYTSEIKNCYNSGKLNTEGNSNNCTSICNCCSNIDCCYNSGTIRNEVSYSICLNNTSTVFSEIQMKNAQFYTGFDFDNIWIIDDKTAYKYPQLRDNRQDTFKEIDIIEIKKAPDKVTYKTGDELVVDGGIITVYYMDSTNEDIPITEEMVSGYDMSVEGTQNVTVTLRGNETTFPIEITKRPNIKNITIISQPNKTEFVRDTELDYTGAVARINYVDGTYDDVKLTPKNAPGADISKSGTYTATYTFGDFSTSFTVKVIPIKIESITMISLPDKLVYLEREDIDVTGIKIGYLYNNGKIEEIDDENYTLDYSTEAGVQTVTVNYNNYFGSFDIEIKHDYVVSTVNPTCTTKGYDIHKCSICNNEYTDNYVNELGHKIVTDVAVAPTCTTAGKTEGSHCSVCGEILVAQNEVKALGHKEVIDNAVLPSCTATGKTEGTHCSVCGEIIIPQTTISAKGHSYSEKTLEAATCTENGSNEHTCQNCGDSYIETINAFGHTTVIDSAVESTCTTDGKTEGSHCSLCGEVFVAQQTISASHKWNNGIITKRVSCTDNGIKTYTCTVCGEQKTEPIIAQGHNYTEKVVAPTCTEKGYTENTCLECGDTYKSNYTAPKGHTAETLKAVAPTCTTTGLTEGSYCSVCGEDIVPQIVVNAKGHTAVTDEAIASTCTATGKTEGSHCSVCGETIVAQSTINALGHTATVDEAVVPTCTATGLTQGSHCSVCGETIISQQTVAKVSHSAVAIPGKAATYTSTGLTPGSKCSVCGAVLVAQKPVAKLVVPATTLSKVTSPKSKQMKVTWKKNTKVTGYEVQYSTDKNFKKGNKTVKVTKNKTTSTTIKKLKSKKKYYVRIRTYKTVNGKKYYSAWSKAKNVKVK